MADSLLILLEATDFNDRLLIIVLYFSQFATSVLNLGLCLEVLGIISISTIINYWVMIAAMKIIKDSPSAFW